MAFAPMGRAQDALRGRTDLQHPRPGLSSSTTATHSFPERASADRAGSRRSALTTRRIRALTRGNSTLRAPSTVMLMVRLAGGRAGAARGGGPDGVHELHRADGDLHDHLLRARVRALRGVERWQQALIVLGVWAIHASSAVPDAPADCASSPASRPTKPSTRFSPTSPLAKTAAHPGHRPSRRAHTGSPPRTRSPFPDPAHRMRTKPTRASLTEPRTRPPSAAHPYFPSASTPPKVAASCRPATHAQPI